MTLVLAVGNTATASIEGLSAAGASPALARHTPAADAEVVTFGRTVRAPAIPVSPSGCPTPALITRAVRELVGVETRLVDAGLDMPTAAPVVDLGAVSGGDVREPTPVPDAGAIIERAIEHGASIDAEAILVGESIPAGTTTAFGVLRALGEPYGVSSSMAENPVPRKEAVAREGLAASGLESGGAAAQPVVALREMGDPVLAAVYGLVQGALDAGTAVTLAGGTQLVAVAALVRHAGIEAPLSLATTRFVAEDQTADVAAAASGLHLDLHVADPGFHGEDHPAMAAYARGEAKEGVGMGGALAIAEWAGVPSSAIRDRVETLYAEVCDGP